MRGQDLLVAPELAELHALVDDAVRAELVDEAPELGVALVNLVAGHEARALVPMQIVPRDGVEGALALGYLYPLAAREAAEAVAVGDDHGAAALDELREVGVVYLAAGEDNPGAVGELRLGLAVPYLLERLLEVGQDKIVRAGLAHELYHMELVAGYRRVRQLAEIAYLGDHVAELVEVLDGLPHGLLGDVDAQLVAQGLDYLDSELGLIVVEAGLVPLHGRVHDGDEELVVLHGIEQEEVLLHTLHGRAALRAEEGAEIVVPALYGALEDAAHIGTVAVGHVIGCDVGRGAARRAQAAREAPRQVEQHLGHIVAVVAQAQLPLVHGPGHQLVLRLLQEILEVNQMLQVFHV